jgi:hypothetical protein
MKFTTPQDFTSLAELLRLYGDADEIVFKSHCRLDVTEIAEICREARLLAHRLRLRHPAGRAEEIAASLGCRIRHEAWQMADGRMIYLAEGSFPPKAEEATIRVNTDAVTSLSELMWQWADEAERGWFTEAMISEVAVAHELFHIIERRPSSPLAEVAAHAFARALTQLPFSPLLYQALLARLATGKRAARR